MPFLVITLIVVCVVLFVSLVYEEHGEYWSGL